ncbi:LytR/AlgR family response regulator transcription factor [Neptunitalea lumnitzerae]|uniref:DNA-binding response regulator n=1 Tax=Neptunitalea lumnitzerae TaxID=2965509 RepID=A0ABQ5MFX6_9FLAO|nr:response regulator transcription factor [Neptunitalea sp. Y10]GLB48302.1 DNA-binding response regulator [Neptunitalea sp. Y10]
MSEHLTCIIIDDEPPAIRILQKYVAQLPAIECIATTTKAIEALQLITTHEPDVVFLDIQMPDLTGIQLSTLIKDKTHIIFTTAYAQFAVEGFELNAVDYLLKPISFNRFIAAVEKVKKLESSSANTPKVIEKSTANDTYFFVKTDGKNRFKKIVLNNILYLESIKNYVVIHTNTEQVVTYNTLKYFEQNLPEHQFAKIHKSFIVALQKVEKTDTNEVWINEQCLPLGDTFKNTFFDKINDRKL